MKPLGRWLTAFTLSAVLASVSWIFCTLRFDLDVQTSATIAALCASLVGAPLAAWAAHDGKLEPAIESQSRVSPPAGHPRLQIGVLTPVVDARLVRAVSPAIVKAGEPGKVVVLAGLGGVGKTQLAAWHAREAFRAGKVDVLLWVDAAWRDSVVSAFASAARKLIDVVDADTNRAATQFLEWTATTDAQWLVVLDDLTDPTELRGLWPADSPNGRTIVTSRRRDAILFAHNRVVIDVNVFSEAEAVAYLEDKLGLAACEQAAELAADLGYLPLALAQAAAYIEDRGIDCDAYRRRLADGRRQLAALFPREAQPDDYRLTVTTAWTLSIELADKLEPRGISSRILELLSFLAPSGVPSELFVNDAILGYLRASRAVGDSPVDAGDASDALRCLRRLSLASIDENESIASPIVAVHTLLQRVVRESLSLSQRKQAVLACAQALVDMWPSPEQSRQASSVLRTNAHVLIATGEEFLWSEQAHPLLLRLGLSLGSTGDEAGAAVYFAELARKSATRLGGNDRLTLKLLDRAAYWRGESGDAAGALDEFGRLAAESARLLGVDDHQTLDAQYQLARWLGETGRPDEAVRALEDLLPSYARTHGADSPETLRLRSWMAYMKGETGDAAAAILDFDQLVADRMRVLGPDHRDTLAARHLAARWRGIAGDYGTAASTTEAVLTDALQVLGSEHPDTFHMRHSLARWWGFAGDPRRAVESFEALLADRVRILGPDHIYTLANRFQLARWRHQAGDHAQAIDEMAQLSIDRTRILGPNHPDTLQSQGTLAFWRGEITEMPGYVTSRSDY